MKPTAEQIKAIALIVDGEAWKAIEDGRDALPGSLWGFRRDIAMEKAMVIAALPSSPGKDGGQEAARIGDSVLAWMVKYDLLDAGNEYRAEDVVSVLNDLTPSDVTAEVEQLRAENAKFRKALAKIAERADDNLPMYTPGAMVHTAEEALGGSHE